MAVDTLQVVRLSPADAAQALAGVEKRDPRGITTAQDMAHFTQRGECFAIQVPGAQLAYILTVENGQAWVQAAQASSGQFDFEKILSPIIEAQARGVCHSVAFQTARRGLVRKAQRQGYRVTGWILKKDIV